MSKLLPQTYSTSVVSEFYPVDRSSFVLKAQKQIDQLETISEDKSRFELHIPVFMQLVDTMKLCNKQLLEQIFKANSYQSSYKKWWVLNTLYIESSCWYTVKMKGHISYRKDNLLDYFPTNF